MAVLGVGLAGPVAAAEMTLITNASPDTKVGMQIHDTATLSGGVNPTGTIVFDMYGPVRPRCSGPIAFSSKKTVVGNGIYDWTASRRRQPVPTGAGQVQR